MKTLFEVLPGLPGTGPLPTPFSMDGSTYREGLVVKVTPAVGAAWIGNFQRGQGNWSGVLQHPASSALVVIASGQAYLVDPETRALIEGFDGVLDAVASERWLVLATRSQIFALGAAERWRSPEVAVDGIIDLHLEGDRLTAKGAIPSYGPPYDYEDVYEPIELELAERRVVKSAC